MTGSRLAVAGALLLAAGAGAAATRRATPGNCPVERLSPAYVKRIDKALAATTDVLGAALMRAPGGPSYAAAARDLTPLLLGGHLPGRRTSRLTDSGAYYLPFAEPPGPTGPGELALHVADGSEILSGSVNGPSLSVAVGAHGGERYGSCLARLATPSLADGYLPVLETQYADAGGARYRQESFAARVPQTASLVSFVRVTAEPSPRARVVRFTPSVHGLRRDGDALDLGGDTVLVAGAGGRWNGSSLAYAIPAGRAATVYVAWLDGAARAHGLAADPATYAAARASVVAYWRGQLAEGASFDVPETVVDDAERARTIQDLEATWRYSLGNPYQELEYPESLDAASVLGEYGFANVERAELRTALAQAPSLYPDWEMGAKLLTAADAYDLDRDRAAIVVATPTLAGYVARLAAQQARNPRGLLEPERWTSDLPEIAEPLDSEAEVWQALRAMSAVWSRTGEPGTARRAAALATRLGPALRRAVAASEVRLPGGSLFVPLKLDDGERPTPAILQTRDGSYWNYELPYALASGLFPFGGPQADGALRYLLGHGSLLLGQLRINAYSLYPDPRYPISGTDDVYELNLARFLADEDRPDLLDLMLYGQLADGMTRGTFVSGEAASVAPVAGQYYREMYLPPNSVANAAFLETLRVLLVNEVEGASGAPRGLELAFATPRRWLAPGKTIRVVGAPTSFGSVSYVLRARRGSVTASLTLPGSPAPQDLWLRLRLPGDAPLRRVTVDGRGWRRFDASAETIDLTGLHGAVSLTAGFGP